MSEKKQQTVSYKLFELKDSLTDGIKKNEELLQIENDFKALIENSGQYDKFKFMLEDWEAERKKLEDNIDALKLRLKAVEALLEYRKKLKSNTSEFDLIFSLSIGVVGVR